MKLGFVIIAHDNPANVARLARLLIASGSYVSIHYDLKGGDKPVAEIKERLGELAGKLVWAERVRVGWGEWSIVQAMLNAVRAMFASGADPDYIHLMSGADYPIRPIGDFAAFLERHNGTDFIESRSINQGAWVKGGLFRERFHYRHFLNNRKYPKLFTLNWKLQSRLKLKQKTPKDLQIHMGSQWSTLTGQSWRTVLARAEDPKILKFFRWSWIPDEMFVQSMLADSGGAQSNRHLTLYQFSDYGVPVVFYDSHLDFLRRQPFFFARKISPHASKLRDGLDDIVVGRSDVKSFTDEQIGTPTNEYETFRLLYRYGLKGSRVPGFFKDNWFGDLEWNKRPYVAIFGGNTDELEMVAAAIDRMSGLICHRFLFGKNGIGFAGSCERFAGYSRWDTALRDNKPTNFLVDVIGQSPGLTTCFLVNTTDEFKLFDHLRWDSNAYIINLDGGLIGSFLEKNAAFDNAQGSAEKTDAQGRTIIQHLINFFDTQRTVAQTRQKALSEGKAKFATIDVLNSEWRHSLRSVLGELSHEFTRRTPSGSDSPAVARRSRLNLRSDLLCEIVAAAQNREDEKRILREVMAQPKQAYLVLLGTSRGIAARLADALISSQSFRSASGQQSSFAASLMNLIDAHFDSHGQFNILNFGLDEAPGIEIFLNDPDARVVLITDSAESAVVETLVAGPNGYFVQESRKPHNGDVPWCNPVTYQHVLNETAAVISSAKAKIANAVCPVLEIDYGKKNWAAELVLFLRGTFFDLNGDDDALLKLIKSGDAICRDKNLRDPAEVFSNGQYLSVLSRQFAYKPVFGIEAEERFQTATGLPAKNP